MPKYLIAAGCLAASLALSLPASAGSFPSASGFATADTSLRTVEWSPRGRHHRHRGERHGRYSDNGHYSDNVGSTGYDGSPYGYNRYSGQRNQSCVFDEGYGRTRPCDAGGR
jgi:hypothetical protein